MWKLYVFKGGYSAFSFSSIRGIADFSFSAIRWFWNLTVGQYLYSFALNSILTFWSCCLPTCSLAFLRVHSVFFCNDYNIGTTAHKDKFSTDFVSRKLSFLTVYSTL